MSEQPGNRMDSIQGKVVPMSKREKRFEDEQVEALLKGFIEPIIKVESQERTLEIVKSLERKLEQIYNAGRLNQIKEALEELSEKEKKEKMEKGIQPGTAKHRAFEAKIDTIASLIPLINRKIGTLPKPRQAEVFDEEEMEKMRKKREYEEKMAKEAEEFLPVWNEKSPDKSSDGLDQKSV